MSELEMISPKMVKQYQNRKDALIIDLRSKEEYDKYHIPGALHIEYEDERSLAILPKNKEIILYCERGASSMAKAKELMRKGYHVKTLIGGIRAYKEQQHDS